MPRDDHRDDRQLLAAVEGGDQRALRELFDRHARWLTLRLMRRCGDRGMVDETVVDTFERAWRKATTYRGEGDVAAWLWGIAIRRLIDRLRKRVPMPSEPAAVTGRIERRRARLDDEVADQVLVTVSNRDVGELLSRLAPELQAVLQATVLDGLSTKEAAELLGIPTGTVKSRAFRARAALREELS